MNTISKEAIVPANIDTVWERISNFSHAGKQVIAVEKTELDGDKRIVTFKNGHQVMETLIEKNNDGKLIRWSQENKKGFVPLKNIEVEMKLEKISDEETKAFFTFKYDTKMGPIGMMMNMLMVKGKLSSIAEMNLQKLVNKYSK